MPDQCLFQKWKEQNGRHFLEENLASKSCMKHHDTSFYQREQMNQKEEKICGLQIFSKIFVFVCKHVQNSTEICISICILTLFGAYKATGIL